MLNAIATKLSSHPRRTLLIVLIFVVVASVVGGPLAGSLKSSGGFAPAGSDSQVAMRQLESASGAEPSPGVVLVLATPHGVGAAGPRIAAVTRRLGEVPGVLRVSGPAAVARDRHHVLVMGTIRASASDADVASSTESAFGSAGSAARVWPGDRQDPPRRSAPILSSRVHRASLRRDAR